MDRIRFNIVSLILLLVVSTTVLAHRGSASKELPDRLVMIWGDTLKVKLRKVTNESITYSLYGERMRQSTPTSNLMAILYADGHSESYANPPIKMAISEGAAKIKVTYSEDDVQVYKLLADVEGRFEGLSHYCYSNEYLKRMAIENLKEIAFKNDPRVRVLLVEKVNYTRGYGEGPSAVVVAKAFFR